MDIGRCCSTDTRLDCPEIHPMYFCTPCRATLTKFSDTGISTTGSTLSSIESSAVAASSATSRPRVAHQWLKHPEIGPCVALVTRWSRYKLSICVYAQRTVQYDVRYKLSICVYAQRTVQYDVRYKLSICVYAQHTVQYDVRSTIQRSHDSTLLFVIIFHKLRLFYLSE